MAHRLAGLLGALVSGGMIATLLTGQAQAGLSLDLSNWRASFDLDQPENLAILGFLLLFLLLFEASLILFFQRPGNAG